VNLARTDIRYHFVRFFLMTLGVSALLTGTLGMIGLYKGIIFEALLMINSTGTDLWVVQAGRVGPFAENSEISDIMDRRLEGVPGVSRARRFIQFNQQYEVRGRRLPIAITGLDFPKDNGSWLPLVAGRHLYAGHYEAIADQSLGFAVGDLVRMGLDDYLVVGVARGQTDVGGDGLLYVSIPDSQTLRKYTVSEGILLDRARAINLQGGRQPAGRIAAVMVTLQPNADIEQVKSFIRKWGDVAVLTREDEVDIMLNSRLWKLRNQLLGFLSMTFLVTAIVIGLSLYTTTLEKTHQIALLKLIGARDSLIIGMIVEQALLVGAFAFCLSVFWSEVIFPHFPRVVLIELRDFAFVGVVTVILCLIGSWFGIRKALAVQAQEVLS